MPAEVFVGRRVTCTDIGDPVVLGETDSNTLRTKQAPRQGWLPNVMVTECYDMRLASAHIAFRRMKVRGLWRD